MRYAECKNAGCAWCAPPTYSGYCAASPSDCKSPCKKDSDCKSSCDDSGCNLNIYKCSYGNCVYSGTSKFCGYGTKGCAGGNDCDYSAGSCGSGGSSDYKDYTGGGCSWSRYMDKDGIPTKVCSSGCPPDYPNQKWVGCKAIPGCKGDCGYASYDPLKGESPCCTAGGYYTCGKQEICKPTGCVDICTDPATDKNAEPYCSKCNSCQDGIRNCGETERCE